ncbi:MAG: hypothetical protein WBG92_04050 [Thiohalocapsa sp.]
MIDMILSKYFVFIHFPKTGGEFIRKILFDTAPREWDLRDVGHHASITRIPDQYRKMPVFGFVRNPFDWYVSWYAYLRATALENGFSNEFFNRVSDRGRRSFKQTIKAIFENDIAGSKQLDCSFPGSVFGCHVNAHFGSDLSKIRIGKFESLRDDLLVILKVISDPPNTMVNTVRSHKRVNASLRDDYRRYYDNELREMVSGRDRLVLQYFDYRY